jgi:small-conductance mechanosensitive channel
LPRFLAASILLLLTVLAAHLPTAALAQSTAEATAQDRFDYWTDTLDLIEQQLRRADTTAEDAERFYEVTASLREEADKVRSEAQSQLANLERRLAALGPPPGEGEPAEQGDVASRRESLRSQINQLKAQDAGAKVLLVRADELDATIGNLTQQKRFEALFQFYPFPWAPETLRQSLPEFQSVLERVITSPVVWWHSLEEEERRQTVSLRVAVLVFLALTIGWVLRYWLLKRYGRDPGWAAPSYADRLWAAIANALARGAVPALLFGGLWYLSWTSQAPEHSLFWLMVSNFFTVMAFFSLAWALPYAVLSPDLTQWRLLPVTPHNARRLGWRFTLLAAAFAVQIFITAAHQRIGISDAYFSFSTFLLNLLPALILLDTARQSFWVLEDEDSQAPEEEVAPEDHLGSNERKFWRIVRRLVAFIAGISIIASLVGYADFADFLVDNLLFTLIVLGVTAVLRGLVRELIGAALRSDFMRQALEVRHVARTQIKFWLRAILDCVLLLVGAIAIGAVWTSPFGEFWTQVRQLLSGVTIGGVTISITDIVTALVIFAIILLLTRFGQKVLRNKVLPQTGFDSGVQNSLSAGFGYVGIILAAIFGITALGIDLSNIALIAGALSVGIGFGLQAIVSNFVSGIILLIERPIKIGDWVLVGGNEGTVKRITVRSTELTTFQRASVIIPNSEFISTAVINWTHKDTYGRIEVAVGVAYGSDVEKVRDILLDCAARHEMVLTSPEPFVIFMNFGASSLDFELRCYTNNVNYRLVISSDLRFAIDKAFRENGIEIPFPQHVVHFAGKPPSVAGPEEQGSNS